MRKFIKTKPKRLISVFLALLILLSTMMPAMASYAAGIQCKLNIRTSTNYKYMNNWHTLMLATAFIWLPLQTANTKAKSHTALSLAKIWVRTDKKKL